MEKDDFRYSLSFGDDLFGGPDWKTMVTPRTSPRTAAGMAPCHCCTMRMDGPLKRNFVHVDDLAGAILLALDNPVARGQLFNIAMDSPVDYGELAAYLHKTRGLGSLVIPSGFHSNWLDNTKARFDLGWRPHYDLVRLVEASWTYQRPAQDPRKVWYPG